MEMTMPLPAWVFGRLCWGLFRVVMVVVMVLFGMPLLFSRLLSLNENLYLVTVWCKTVPMSY